MKKSIKTAALCDTHEGIVKAALPVFKSYGKKKSFDGEIVTVRVFEDNMLVKEALGKNGKGKVLVVDGGGSLRCALMGDNLAQMALDNKWEGVIIYGCIRDSAMIDTMNVAVKALNTIPLKSKKDGEGERNVPVTFAGVTFKPGDFVYADEDGVVVTDRKMI
ncbi:MAG TPA: ribonuclease E activity regulator RraA [Chitinophagales bacterium]|nr:ribonuclease E activity regulator RraA [Chitinophagales bacterium]